jgi:hypothetical protein
MLSDGESSQLCDCLKEQNIPYLLHSGYSPREYNGAADNAAYVPKSASPQHLVATVDGPETGSSRMPLAAPKSTKISLFEPPTGPSRHRPPLDSLRNFDRRPLTNAGN